MKNCFIQNNFKWQFVMMYLAWDREINIHSFFATFLYENEAQASNKQHVWASPLSA